MMIDFAQFPSPCYIMEEELLRKNLTLIKSVADRAGVEIILAFKSFAMWRSFPIFREYIRHSTASSWLVTMIFSLSSVTCVPAVRSHS